jgi:peptidoglycan/xylan/chitin deacetylase (PgdA/CDA1 family)
MKKFVWPLFLAIVLFASGGCESINRSRRSIGIPRNTVVFSFDDGPNAHEDTTPRLLDVLKKYRIRAMFALLGENAERYPELVRRIRDEGHIIINHGYSDKWALSMTGDEFRENLRRGEAAISAALGEAPYPRLYRPQGGYYKDRHRRIWLEEGFSLVPGSARAYDAVIPGSGKPKVVREILKKLREDQGGLVLLHDGRDSHVLMETELAREPLGSFNRAYIPEAAEEIILALLRRGFRLSDIEIQPQY